ncbi:hypothetical protein CYLTODRAFT_353124 [Cylindrobasidium torrendii FP15055 ss-10]|uniref:Uncharacterized protein n=1 Tax=Cylindrobasidium torrendii FP15055 ss-10 TaxID=1314674 RepID=A0A0D7BAB6_9AGAR|nr:hypothetical protein CYLTODRAFT_353124 [Cylindrobasidium torrendii FP15055 ss-10]
MSLINQQQSALDDKSQVAEERWNEKADRRRDKENQRMEQSVWLQDIIEKMEQCKADIDLLKTENASKADLERIIEQLRAQNEEQQALLRDLSESWRADCAQHHDETLRAIDANADKQIPYNIQGYLDDFSKSLASEVRILLGEVGKLREERRGLQSEIGYLLCTRSKYGPGGEYNADWKVPNEGPLAPHPVAPEAPAPELPPEIPSARPAWRSVPLRRTRKKKSDVHQQPPPPEMGGPQMMGAPFAMDPRHQVRSWSTWQPDPANAPTPPSVEPNLIVPDQRSLGLFGPRSQSSSIRG